MNYWKPGRWIVLLCVLLMASFGNSVVSKSSDGGVGPTTTTESQTHSQNAPTSGHEDPVTPLLLGLSIVLLAAKVGGELMLRLKLPAVLGELLVGVLLGNLVLVGIDSFEFLRVGSQTPGDHGQRVVAITLDMLARVGVILLLFEVGLESNIHEMRKVGWSSLLVAILGVVAPFGLGWLVGQWMLPAETWHVHMFIGATLCATSVGITARVLKDLRQTDSPVAKIVLGAAVIDDVLGLVLLAVVQAVIVQGTASLQEVGWIAGKAFLFLMGSVIFGDWLSPRLFRLAAALRVHGMLMVTGLLFCFALAWLASHMGLAPIVGAFAAGMILDKKHYETLEAREERSLEDWVIPVTMLLVPIFFVMMGFQVDLRSFRDPSVLLLAAAITAAAIVGKQVCSIGVLSRGIDRLSVGIGMIPRGEVGLIFAAIGQELTTGGHAVISPAVYSAIVVMVMVTTLMTPPLLSWSLQRGNRNAAR